MPSMAKPPPELIALFDAILPEDVRVQRKSMFGMPAAFTGGNMFAGLYESLMTLRLPAEKRTEFLALPGALPFAPMLGRVMKEYAVVPEAMLGDRKMLASWVEIAFEFAAGMAVKEKKAPAPRRQRPA
jgi:TfoX/Sxy family transcriptional regulator of competence genes